MQTFVHQNNHTHSSLPFQNNLNQKPSGGAKQYGRHPCKVGKGWEWEVTSVSKPEQGKGDIDEVGRWPMWSNGVQVG